jgi:hypothetical protein
MKHFKTCIVSLALFCLCAAPAVALADQGAAGSADDKVKPAARSAWCVEAKVKRLFNSHTSYEFGNPTAPYQEPLSRLEFGLDSWWGGVEISRRTPMWSVSFEFLRNVTNTVDGQLADSDWTDATNTSLRTIYSESDLKMDASYMINASADLSVAKWLGLPKFLDLRPVGGVRYQYFDVTANNLTQWETLSDGSIDTYTYAGDVIAFDQTYWQFFIGLRFSWELMPSTYPGLMLKTQLDWAYVDAENRDHHLIREGIRITEDSTDGHAWHGMLGLVAPIASNFSLELQAEYLEIDTSGSHHWFNEDPAYAEDYTWDNGVNVWSRQVSMMLALRYCF